MVHVSLDTPYMVLFKDLLAQKHRLALDAWGADDQYVRPVYQHLIDLVKKEVKPEHQVLYPAPVWKLQDRVGRLARNILVSEFFVKPWAEHFRGKSDEEIDAIARSFHFDNCLHRDTLNKILQENAALQE